jgi:hypothetical protein
VMRRSPGARVMRLAAVERGMRRLRIARGSYLENLWHHASFGNQFAWQHPLGSISMLQLALRCFTIRPRSLP